MEHKLFFFNRTFDIYESLLCISNIQLCVMQLPRHQYSHHTGNIAIANPE